MKKAFEKIAMSLGLSVSNYYTYRSDMGVQIFKVAVNNNDIRVLTFEDGYFVGGNRSTEQLKVLNMFEHDLKKVLSKIK